VERYYKTDIRRVPLRLVWSWGGGGFLAYLVRKWLPFPWYGPGVVPATLGIVPVRSDDADPHLFELIERETGKLEKLGFRPELLYRTTVLGPARGLGRALLAHDGGSVCLVVAIVNGPHSQTSVHCFSESGAGSIFGASSAVLHLPPVPGIDVLRLPGRSAHEVATAHMHRVASRTVRKFTGSDIVPLLRALQERSTTYYLSQGIYVEASPDDVASARRS
jgi:hypothetical protein